MTLTLIKKGHPPVGSGAASVESALPLVRGGQGRPSHDVVLASHAAIWSFVGGFGLVVASLAGLVAKAL